MTQRRQPRQTRQERKKRLLKDFSKTFQRNIELFIGINLKRIKQS